MRKALADVRANTFLHALAITTICLIFLLAGSFALVFVNVTQLVRAEHESVRMMAYLATDAAAGGAKGIREAILAVPGVRQADFIPSSEALDLLEAQMEGQAGLLRDMGENPLPDGFEILVDAGEGDSERIDNIARRIRSVNGVVEVNYGQAWLERFAVFIDMTRLIGAALACLLVVASVSITSNTIRLVLYNRREEIQIMRLVGATETFIRAPFYIQGILQGLLGGVLALGLLAGGFAVVISGAQNSLILGRFEPRFLPVSLCVAGIALAAVVGWMGCYLSFRQFERA